MQKKVPYVAQLGNMDCSIACMTMLFRYYGLDVDIVDVGQVVHIGRDGVNLTQLKQATQQFGFKCTAYRYNKQKNILDSNLPAVVYSGSHLAVIGSKTVLGQYILLDPIKGKSIVNFEQIHDTFSDILYEDELFCEADGNWKDIRKGSTNGKNLCAWCHGAGGILLSRISLLGNIDNETDEIVKEDIRNAVKTMQSHKYLQNPCVCHGIAGNAEILLTYGQQFQDQIASSTAKHFYSRLVGSVNSGTFECSRPYLYGFNIPGFMTGLAGIGYSLLRLLDPTLPSVLQINI